MRLLFDMDGVAADWVGPALNFTKCKNADTLNKHPYVREMLFAMYIINPDFFLKLPRLHYFKHMMKLAMSAKGITSIGYLSSIGDIHPDRDAVMAHKRMWVFNEIDLPFMCLRELGYNTYTNCIFKDGPKGKATEANEHTILVDDHYRNTDAFKQAGGHVFLVPEEGYTMDTVDKFEEYLKHLGVA